MIKVFNCVGDDEYIDDRERDKRERKKFVDASKMRRVSQFTLVILSQDLYSSIIIIEQGQLYP